MQTYTYHYDSPLGGITIASDGNSLTGLWFDGQKYFGDTLAEQCREKDLPVFNKHNNGWTAILMDRIQGLLRHYFLDSTPFRLMVWDILQQTPIGQTLTYGEIRANGCLNRKVSLLCPGSRRAQYA